MKFFLNYIYWEDLKYGIFLLPRGRMMVRKHLAIVKSSGFKTVQVLQEKIFNKIFKGKIVKHKLVTVILAEGRWQTNIFSSEKDKVMVVLQK